MRKHEIRKLRLSKETLRDLTSSEAGMVLGGTDSAVTSCQTARRCCMTSVEDPGEFESEGCW
jgi:hypothetical protein